MKEQHKLDFYFLANFDKNILITFWGNKNVLMDEFRFSSDLNTIQYKTGEV